MKKHLVAPFRSTLRLGASTAAAAAAALLLAGPSLALATDLTVDQANGNSPYTFNASATYNLVTVGNTSTGVLNHSAGTLTSNFTLNVGSGSGANGTYNLSGTGVLVFPGAYPLHVGNNGTGTLNQSGGTNSGSELYVGRSGNGTYNLSGGVLSAGPSYIAWNRGSTGTFTQSGGTHNLGGFFEIGYFGSASYTLSGTGVLNAGNEDLAYGDSASGTFTQNGGIHTVDGRMIIAQQGGSVGTYKLNGGTLVIRRVIGGDGTTTFNFNGGTFQAKASDNPAASNIFMSGVKTANVQAGGAKIDTNGFIVTAAQNLVHDTTAGAPAVDGGLTKSGAGMLTLTGANTYTGGTIFAGGTLNVGSAGALASSGTLSFTGGSLQYSAANMVDYSNRFSTMASQAYTVDTNAKNVSFATGLTSSGGTLTKLGAGTLTLTGANTYSGATTISAGTLQVGSGSTSGSVAGNIVNNAALLFNRSDALTYSGAISGSGSLTKSGAGTLTLSGPNTQTGGTVVSAGTLALGSAAALGTAGNINIAAQTTLDVLALADSSYTLDAGRTLTNLGRIRGNLTIADGATMTALGLLNGSLTVNNGGLVLLTSSGTINGSLLVESGALLTLRGSGLLAVGDGVVNNGVMRFEQGAALALGNGSGFINNGVLDVITGSFTAPNEFTNNGVVLDSSVVRAKSVSRSGGIVTVVIDSYTGHTYHLQRRDSLTSGTFNYIGNPQNGSTGTPLTFTDPSPAVGQGFYRVAVDP